MIEGDGALVLKLVDLFEEDSRIAESLLDYNNINKEIYKCFLDIAMPACSKHSFSQAMMFEGTLGDVTTVAEESFAMLVLENNIDRWKHLALEEDGPAPTPKFQKKIKKGKNAIDSVGDWTEDGMVRFNEISALVKTKRNESGQIEFENELKQMYEEEGRSGYGGVGAKRRHMETLEGASVIPQVTIIILFDRGTINSL